MEQCRFLQFPRAPQRNILNNNNLRPRPPNAPNPNLHPVSLINTPTTYFLPTQKGTHLPQLAYRARRTQTASSRAILTIIPPQRLRQIVSFVHLPDGEEYGNYYGKDFLEKVDSRGSVRVDEFYAFAGGWWEVGDL